MSRSGDSHRLLAFLFALGLCLPMQAGAVQAASRSVGESGLPIPRFVSLSSNKVNMRTGPGVRYPVAWVYRRARLPLMVTGEYQYWRKVRDIDGAEGWIHKSLLSGRRTAIVQDGVRALRASPSDGAPTVALAEPGVIGMLVACDGAWCRLEADEHAGWLPRPAIFGALPNEDFD